MSEQALGASQWRAIRLFLSSITDQELDDVRGYLAKELAARQECEDSITRLLFSSLTPLDLKTASQLLQTEEAARVHERSLLLVEDTKTKPRRRRC
jgi:hypothetical protein